MIFIHFQKHLPPVLQKAWHQVHMPHYSMNNTSTHTVTSGRDDFSVANWVPKKQWGFGEYASSSDLAKPRLVRILSVLPKSKGELKECEFVLIWGMWLTVQTLKGHENAKIFFFLTIHIFTSFL